MLNAEKARRARKRFCCHCLATTISLSLFFVHSLLTANSGRVAERSSMIFTYARARPRLCALCNLSAANALGCEVLPVAICVFPLKARSTSRCIDSACIYERSETVTAAKVFRDGASSTSALLSCFSSLWNVLQSMEKLNSTEITPFAFASGTQTMFLVFSTAPAAPSPCAEA